MSRGKQVHVTDLDGNLKYTRLWDDGGLVLRFDSGHGFVDRLFLQDGQVRPGWPKTGNEGSGFDPFKRKPIPRRNKPRRKMGDQMGIISKALRIRVIESTQGDSVKVEVGGVVGRIGVSGESVTIHLGLDVLDETLVSTSLRGRVWRSDGSGKDIPYATMRKIEQAVLDRLRVASSDRAKGRIQQGERR